MYQYGIFQLKYPFFEVLFMQYLIFCYFLLIKLNQNIAENQKDYIDQGRIILRTLVAKKSSTLKNIFMILLPLIEILFSIMILFSGLNQLDFFHIVFYFIFVFFIGYPQNKTIILKFTVHYCEIFFILKYTFSMISQWI